MERMKTLDLHGYTIDEATDALDRFLYNFGQSGELRAKIITGKGTGKIQTAARNYLKQAGYQFQNEKLSNGKPNEGVLIIFG